MNIYRERAQIVALESERIKIQHDAAEVAKRIAYLEPLHRAERWAGHRHPETRESMEDMGLSRGTYESRLRAIELDLAIHQENLRDYLMGPEVGGAMERLLEAGIFVHAFRMTSVSAEGGLPRIQGGTVYGEKGGIRGYTEGAFVIAWLDDERFEVTLTRTDHAAPKVEQVGTLNEAVDLVIRERK